MKPQIVIEQRLRTLRIRYTKKYMMVSQERLPQNCVHNFEYIPTGSYPKSCISDVDFSLRKSATLVVIQPDAPIRICLYGADSPATWQGDICDKPEISKSCPWFKPKVSITEARDDFSRIISDDSYVLDNYPDVAALQWVLGIRIHKKKFSLWERFSLWFLTFLFKAPKLEPKLPDPDIPEDLWKDANNTENPSK